MQIGDAAFIGVVQFKGVVDAEPDGLRLSSGETSKWVLALALLGITFWSTELHLRAAFLEHLLSILC